MSNLVSQEKGFIFSSRLNIPDSIASVSLEKVAPHNARRLYDFILITNDLGEHAFLLPGDYNRYLQGSLSEEEPLAVELIEKGFFRNRLNFRHWAERAIGRNLLDGKGASVHTVVVTLRCNFKCLYCHASVVGLSQIEKDMSVEIAKKTVDVIFQSPSPSLMIEFQGGEPLLNWPIVQWIVLYARKKNKIYKKNLHFALISNFSFLNEEKMNWLIGVGVSFCTSLDGSEDLHNKNRIYLGGNTYCSVLSAVKRLRDLRAQGIAMDAPNAICTVTRHSLDFPKEIVDELVGQGFKRIQLGPLDPIGFAKKSWNKIGYNSREFVNFYSRALDYIIDLNRRGVDVYEKMALIFLVRILNREQWRFPNAEGISRLAYNYDGSVYLSEDGRLIANEGDDFFKIGHVSASSYQDFLEHPTLRATLLAGNSSLQPQCFQCAYNPFCTVLPTYNYQVQGSPWGHMPTNGWCEKMMGIFDLIFSKLNNPSERAVLESWLKHKDN